MSITEDQFSAVKDIAADHNEAVMSAEELLAEIITEGRQRAAPAELHWFAQHVNWSELQVRQELRRVAAVLRLRSIAGTVADREAAAAEATTASEVLAKEGAKVAEQIAKLEAKLRSLESDARLSAKRCEEQGTAVEQLRGLVPQNIRDVVRDRVSRIEHSIGRQIADAEIRANELDVCLAQDKFPNPQSYFEMLQRSFPAAIVEGSSGGWTKRKLSPDWSSIRAGMEAELGELVVKLERLRSQFASEIATAEKPLNHYAG